MRESGGGGVLIARGEEEGGLIDCDVHNNVHHCHSLI